MEIQQIEEGQILEMDIKNQKGKMTVTAEVLGDTAEDQPDGIMFHIEEITRNGEEATEELLQKAFDGERTRGAPYEKLEEMDEIRCTGAKLGDGDEVTIPMEAEEK